MVEMSKDIFSSNLGVTCTSADAEPKLTQLAISGCVITVATCLYQFQTEREVAPPQVLQQGADSLCYGTASLCDQELMRHFQARVQITKPLHSALLRDWAAKHACHESRRADRVHAL